MRPRSRTYRTTVLLLALVLAGTGAAPLVGHLCAPGHMRMQGHEAPAVQAKHACCPAHCKEHAPPATEALSDAPCCAVAPAAPADARAVATPEAPRTHALVLAALVLSHAAPAPPPAAVQGAADTSPPPLLRRHLALSVLLI